jgi:hypothetical protein
MLLFTQCSVYWLAVPPNPFDDLEFLGLYNTRTNFAARNRQRLKVDSGNSGGSTGIYPASPGLMPWLVHPRDLEELYHCFYRRMPMRISEIEIKDHIEKQRQDNADQVVRALRADLAAEAWRLHGMTSRMPVLVCHAESVLALHVGKKLNLANIYEQAFRFQNSS